MKLNLVFVPRLGDVMTYCRRGSATGNIWDRIVDAGLRESLKDGMRGLYASVSESLGDSLHNQLRRKI